MNFNCCNPIPYFHFSFVNKISLVKGFDLKIFINSPLKNEFTLGFQILIYIDNEVLKTMDKKFWLLIGEKFIEICISVKVLTIAACLTISTFLIMNNFMTGSEWAMFNGGVISTIIGLREAFKVAKVRSKDSTENLNP